MDIIPISTDDHAWEAPDTWTSRVGAKFLDRCPQLQDIDGEDWWVYNGERVRKVGGTTLHSIGNIARLQRIPDNDADYVDPLDMLAELRSDNQALITSLRETHDLCDEENDVATTSLIEMWIDQAERRVWFLYEASRRGDPGGH